jgi:hypothetical protein
MIPRQRFALPHLSCISLLAVWAIVADMAPAFGQTAQGELEARPAPVALRKCVAGANAGNLCKQDSECPGSSCADRNVYNIGVAVQYDAPAADLTAIENMISAGSAVLFDVTDGQAEIGLATIHNNAFGTTDADLRVYPATCSSGTSIGTACNVHNDCPPNPPDPNTGRCGVWWQANTGSWQVAGSMHVSINNINNAANPGPVIGHEFVHLVFDAKDEYEDSPGCVGNPGAASCPVAAAIPAGGQECLMDSNGTELCWGQGDPADLADISGGNHDPTNVTEQSQCRSNRSCWDQVVWSWPKTILKPAAAPDPAANGLVVNATRFTVTDNTARVVLVLDESGSMTLESPSRMERLQVAAKDFVALAESGIELGLVSYSDDADPAAGRANVPITAVTDLNRGTWNTPITNLAPDNFTNIGAGLAAAKQMIDAAGGVTGNTFIVLMTDGRNNRPAPQASADADLDAKLADLLAAGIPVYVTCTGSDNGLQSQCSEIAAGTGGFYVDSAAPDQLPEAFVDIHERISGREALDSARGFLSKAASGPPTPIFVDAGSDSVTFTLSWENPAADADMLVFDPDGRAYDTMRMPQGRFFRMANPAPGEWQVQVRQLANADSRYVARAYTRNRTNNMRVGIRHASVLPGEDVFVYAYPTSRGGAISNPSQTISARVTLPDGSTDTVELNDQGRQNAGGGDDLFDDGIFTGVYRNATQKGAYTFQLDAAVDRWSQSGDHEDIDPAYESPRFMREVRVSAAVGLPGDVVSNPEDDVPGTGPGNCESCRQCANCVQCELCKRCEACAQVNTLLWLVIVLLLVAIALILWCCKRRG